MTSKILEAAVQSRLRDKVMSLGFGCHKMISDPKRGGTPGMPDTLVVLSHRKVEWVECKRPETVERYRAKRSRFFETGNTQGCSKTEIRQFREQQKLRDLNQVVSILGTYEEVDLFCNSLAPEDWE